MRSSEQPSDDAVVRRHFFARTHITFAIYVFFGTINDALFKNTKRIAQDER